MPSSPDVHVRDATTCRCADGIPCVDVAARVAAAHRTIYAEGCRLHGEELLAIARQIAAAHGHPVAEPNRPPDVSSATCGDGATA